MNKVTDYITYLPASSEPLSADVYFIEGDTFCYIFDVGNNEAALQKISTIEKEKIVILSHYHKDHTGNMDKLTYKELYVGDLTKETIQKGTVVNDKVVILDGVEVAIQHCPSPHTKGSLIVTVNKEYTLIADLHFTKADYDKKLARKMLEVLEQLDTKYFIVSHQQKENVFEKKKFIAELKEYFIYIDDWNPEFLYKELLDRFVSGSIEALGHNLTGIYLHGSAVMGCFQPGKSDLDLLVVVKEEITDEVKRQFMDMAVELNKQAPTKGMELSIVKEAVCKPFVYPTPFELHFSNAHLNWYQSNPLDYIEKMKGTDKDLAAHFTITYHRGQVLYGKEISEVFAPVSSADYLDSIRCDIENAVEEIAENPMYLTLNLCRVLAYKKEELIVSKQEGGEWGLNYIERPEFQTLILQALKEYQSGDDMVFEPAVAREFAEYMLREIWKDE